MYDVYVLYIATYNIYLLYLIILLIMLIIFHKKSSLVVVVVASSTVAVAYKTYKLDTQRSDWYCNRKNK